MKLLAARFKRKCSSYTVQLTVKFLAAGTAMDAESLQLKKHWN